MNSAEVKKILGKTATLEFRMVDESNNNPIEAASTGHVPLGSKPTTRATSGRCS